MGSAIQSGVSGLKASQTWLDVTGNNLANMNTTAYKAGSVTFKDLLYSTLRYASQPSAGNTSGGINPMQSGSGVQVANIARNMSQGTLTSTGQSLDMAIEGSGFFNLTDSSGGNVYTRAGSFAVDASFYLVDPTTGYYVVRTPPTGESPYGFQTPGDLKVRVPYDRPLPASATSLLTYVGNLSADDTTATSQVLSSGTVFTVGTSTTVATVATDLNNLSQTTGTMAVGDTITGTFVQHDGGTINFVFGYNSTGTSAVVGSTVYTSGTTLGELCNGIAMALGSSTVSCTVDQGEIRVSDGTSGYSLLDLKPNDSAYVNTNVLTVNSGSGGDISFPNFFTINSAGGAAARSTSITVYDSQGMSHVLSATFVKNPSSDSTWDMVMADVTNSVSMGHRRITGITFDSNGAIQDLAGTDTTFTVAYAFDSNPVTLTTNLGTAGSYNGLTQFGGSSTAAASAQDGYAAGYLSNVQVQSSGQLVGTFTNGIRAAIADLRVVTFQNPNGLSSLGNNYWEETGNSGVPQQGNAGSVRGGSLESSNVDTATEFVNLIQAQNSYQANSRTIRTANDMLQELANLIR